MCDNDSLDDMTKYELRAGVSRRQFGAITLGAGALAMMPEFASAAAMETTEAEVTIKTDDGTCDAYVVHPSKGKHPAVLIWPDIFGLRPTFRQMGKRLSESGYAVLVVNPFYRVKKAPTAPEKANFEDPATRKALMALAGGLSPATAAVDAKAFISWLDKQAAVDNKKKIGTTILVAYVGIRKQNDVNCGRRCASSWPPQ
jgi:carboxymethylenebutenolidase